MLTLLSGMVSAQVNLGSIKGTVINDENKVLPGAKVWVNMDGSMVGVKSDIDGNFSIEALKPGVYNLYAISSGMDTLKYTGVEVRPDQFTGLGEMQMQLKSFMGGVLEVKYIPNVLEVEIERMDIPLEDIENSPNIQNPMQMFADRDSNIKIDEATSQPIIRGSRPGDAVFYIDGVKSTSMGQIPGVAIGSMAAYTGGIPAKYGDTTGGVIILESKSYFDLYYRWKANQ